MFDFILGERVYSNVNNASDLLPNYDHIIISKIKGTNPNQVISKLLSLSIMCLTYYHRLTE